MGAEPKPSVSQCCTMWKIMSDERSYKNDDIRAIIDRALQTQPQEGVSHEDLLAIGSEVGLSRAAIERAAVEVQAARAEAEATCLVVSRRRRGFAIHATVFALVNAFLFTINYLSTPGEWWFLFSLVAWGLGLALHAAFGLSRSVSPRRLTRAKRRLQQQRDETATLSAPPVPRPSVRIGPPAVELPAAPPAHEPDELETDEPNPAGRASR